MKDQKENTEDKAKKDQEEDIFATEETIIEEIAIDGICGVY
jgi:mycofactocin precursor